MQSARRNAVESVKETAGDIGASARAGLEKTKAIVEEKVDKVRAHNDAEKEAAEVHKEVRVAATELNKQLAVEQNAAQRADTTTGPGYTTGPTHMSVLPEQNNSTDINPSLIN